MVPEARKTWTRPELVVIVRGEPEEAVLTACKSWWEGANGFDSINYACLAIAGTCADCSQIPDS
jgi:hypothetical protein